MRIFFQGKNYMNESDLVIVIALTFLGFYMIFEALGVLNYYLNQRLSMRKKIELPWYMLFFIPYTGPYKNAISPLKYSLYLFVFVMGLLDDIIAIVLIGLEVLLYFCTDINLFYMLIPEGVFILVALISVIYVKVKCKPDPLEKTFVSWL